MNCCERLLSIGGFAHAAGLSQKALRLYAQLGLLLPASVDQFTGYRYYHPEQLPRARLIRMLRQMEMPLATIRRVLSASAGDAEHVVDEFVAELEQRLTLARRLAVDVVAFLTKEEQSMLTIQVQEVPEQTVLSVQYHVHVDALHTTIVDSINALAEEAHSQGLEPAGHPFGIYHGPINHEEDGPVQICIPIATAGKPTDTIDVVQIPAATVAWVSMRDEQCEFPAILEGYDATIDWIHSQGFKTAGSPREVWHSPTHMEILWPFESNA